MVTQTRSLNIVFIREFKSFTAMYNKKGKNDYILNVNKIIKDKFNSKFIVPNKVQSFLINYEIKKLLDKAIKIKNEKYDNIIYLNSNISISLVRNAMQFISDEYHPIKFKYSLIESKALSDEDFRQVKGLTILKIE